LITLIEHIASGLNSCSLVTTHSSPNACHHANANDLTLLSLRSNTVIAVCNLADLGKPSLIIEYTHCIALVFTAFPS
jgi:hypothetical protein